MSEKPKEEKKNPYIFHWGIHLLAVLMLATGILRDDFIQHLLNAGFIYFIAAFCEARSRGLL